MACTDEHVCSNVLKTHLHRIVVDLQAERDALVEGVLRLVGSVHVHSLFGAHGALGHVQLGINHTVVDGLQTSDGSMQVGQ
jgi:hypothetical protein